MTYTISWSSQINSDTGQYAASNIGKNTINVADNSTDTSTVLTLTGRGWSGYGAIQQENFIRLMENFASEIAPQNQSTGGNPTVGQLWYKTNNQTLSLYVAYATAIATVGTLVGGTGYNGGAAGTFSGVPLTGGTGTGATATITVNSSGVITAVTISAGNGGTGYVVGDVLTATPSSIGAGGGSGFSISVATVATYYGWNQVFPALVNSASIASSLGYTPYNGAANPSKFISMTGTGGYPLSSAVLGTANEIIVTPAGGTGVLTLSTPQAIGTTSTPTFAQLTISNSPVNSTDATNKAYVDAATTGLSWKNSVKCATTTNITLSGLQTIDGYTTLAGDRVLVKNQTGGSQPTQNGIYVAASGTWSRSTDASTGPELSGAAVYVDNGTVNANTAWTCTSGGTISIGTTNITFAQFGGGATYSAGAGINITGNTIANNGIISLASGTGITVSGPANTPTLAVNSSQVVTSITGSANVTVSASTGAVTISLPATCGINISGSAATLNGYVNSPTAGIANRIVQADGSGYISNTYFNSTDNTATSGMTGVIGKFGDNFHRTATAAAVATFLSGSSMNINGNALTATTATNATNASYSVTQSSTNNSTAIATTAFVQSVAGYSATNPQVKTGLIGLNAGSNTYSFPTAFPTACLSVMMQPYSANAEAYPTSYSRTGFNCNVGATQDYFYLAHGY